MNVSNSKITKTFQKCGFSGYKDFKSAISLDERKDWNENKVTEYLNNTLIYSYIFKVIRINLKNDIFRKHS